MKIKNDNGCRTCGHAHWWVMDSWEVSKCANPNCKCTEIEYAPADNLEYLEQLYDKKTSSNSY